ncbi:hypothetical protein FB451DRAFT_460022 [Mycena latifolia]|nr:hypothetical protein FB451DRAFT_460022 [Mycena latifolia]
MVKQFASAADELLRKDRGGCKLDTAKVCLRLTGDMNRPNFVLAHFDPSHFYEPTANDRDIVANGWDIFVNLITKAITGNRSKPNYVTGSHRLSLIVLAFYPFLHRIPGATGPTVTRVFRFLIHFLIDFRYHPERQHDGLNQTFRKLSSEIKSLESDIESLDSSSNPLLDSMQRYSSSLCAIWDLWEVIPATPGDLGIMIPGDDPRRPRFKKIVNLTVNIQAWLSELGQAPPMVTSYPEYAEQQYVPSDSCWSSDPLDALTIRHTLRLGSASISEPSMFVFSRARRISLLGNSWNYHAAWSYLRHISNTGELSALAAEHHIDPEDLILTFSSSQSKGYAHIILKTAERRGDLLAEVGAKGGLLYYFENLAAVEGELCGYWSSCEAPGQPLWGGLPQSPGPDWGWEYSDGDFKVEIGRTGPVQHIRYVSL